MASSKSNFELIERDGYKKITTFEGDSLEDIMEKLNEKVGNGK